MAWKAVGVEYDRHSAATPCCAQVNDSVTITNALVCEGAVIKEGAIIEPGSVVGFKVPRFARQRPVCWSACESGWCSP